MNILLLSTGYTRPMPDPAGLRILAALCEHQNQIDEPDYDLEETLTTCVDCGAVYNAAEGIWYEA